ncbi:glycosyltransferase family 4 protein [uncultured Desulfosarcina sp.]|uniref:glycosyltransferase family 4 protein n=1 Tax=uncultured Desulfosarcina sp. TaxID=218289 RepID=UPI0029C6C19E|nr:glycosyltransferase family 4 protein [uncultured Desulfosarcina sp.]
MLTTMPNRYSTFSSEARQIEHMGAASIRRIALPYHQSGMADQSRAFLHFAREVRGFIHGRRYDAVFATSSRLATGFLGAWVARRYRVPLYLDIRDIFADTMEDVLNGSPLRVLLPAVKAVERYTLRSAATINVVSAGFLPYFKTRNPKKRFRCYPNGIDEGFLEYDFKKIHTPGVPKTILYAGNIGEGQGLHRIVPELARLAGDNWRMTIVGDGGRRRELERQIRRSGLTNIERLDPVPRGALMELYRKADVLFLHLNDYKAFKRVLPSKVFEYAATGKAMLAGVAGHAAGFIKKHIDNAAVFPPCDAAAGVLALHRLNFTPTPREAFISRYTRSTIMERMVDDMLHTFDRVV